MENTVKAARKEVTRYHPALVALHWVVALLVLGNLAAGMFILENIANDVPAKQDFLRLHMFTGLSVLALMLARILVRIVTSVPPSPHSSKPLRLLAKANHLALYFFIIAMVSTGLGMAQQGGLFALLQGQNIDLPPSFAIYAPYAGHGLFSIVLLVLLAVHVGAVAWHYLSHSQNLFPRIWFGPRNVPAGAESQR